MQVYTNSSAILVVEEKRDIGSGTETTTEARGGAVGARAPPTSLRVI